MLLIARKDFDGFVDTKDHASIMKREMLSKFIASLHLSDDREDKDRAKLSDPDNRINIGHISYDSKSCCLLPA